MSTWVFDKPFLKNERRESVTSRKTRKGKGEEERKKRERRREGGKRKKKLSLLPMTKFKTLGKKL